MAGLDRGAVVLWRNFQAHSLEVEWECEVESFHSNGDFESSPLGHLGK